MAQDKHEPSDLRVETAGAELHHLQDVDITDKTLNAEALEATAAEHSLGFIQGFKTYKRAAFWSIGGWHTFRMGRGLAD